MSEQKSLPPSAPALQAPPSKAPPAKPGITRPVAGAKRSTNFASLPFWFGLIISLAWGCGVIFIVAQSGPTHTFGGVPLIDWAIGVSAIVSPVALVWMIAAYLQRAADVQTVAEPLRRQLSMITGESGAAEARIRRFNQAIREQVELLRSAQGMTKTDLVAIMDRVRSHKSELERLEQGSIHQVKDIQDIIRRNMQQVEQMMDDKFTMMRVLDDRLVQNGDGVARQVEAVRDQVANLLEEIEGNSQHLAETLGRVMQDSKKLSDTARAQENSLVTAAESAAETLGAISGKIDLSVVRFMERAGTAREEAERLAGALDVQTRALDEFSNTLPTRVGEAESVLRGVADRLYASEQLAREQAVNLSEKLSSQVDGLQQFMDRFSSRLADIDGGLQNRHNDLDALGRRIGDTTETFVQSWEKSVGYLSERADSMIARFTGVNEETRQRADQVSAQLSATVEQYETSASRMRAVTEDSSYNMKSATTEISAQLAQFEALRMASQQAGKEVQDRASAAMQNFQHILERLLSARDAVQSVGGTLVKDLHGAVDQNENLIGRLNEAAQMSVRALGIATESLGKQEGTLATQARAAQSMLQEATVQLQEQAQVAERGLRDQAKGLMELLSETQLHMSATDEKLQSFASRTVPPIQDALRQVDDATEHGLKSLGFYGEGVQEQLNRLHQFNGRITGMGEELGRVTSETVVSIESLTGRFATARVAQEETVRQAMGQFNDMADRLQREVAGLDGQTTQAVGTLQQAAARVGEQSYQLLQNAENSGAKMQLITTALQNEAAQIRSVLQKQADDLGADLSRAEKQFSTLGEALRQRTDAAYALLDRVAVHYNETTRTAAQDLEMRTQRIEQVTGQAQDKVEALNTTLAEQIGLLDTGASKLETHASDITSLTGKTLQQLSAVNEKFVVTHEAANGNMQSTIARLDECNTAFMRQSNSLTDAAQTASSLIQKAGVAFGEQAGKMLDTSHQMDQSLRQLTATTSALADQSTQIRSVMEQQNQRLIAQLTESVTQLETTGNKLERSVVAATLGADQASTRFTEVTQSASQRLGASHQEMQAIAGKAENTLAALGANITQQAASLSVISEQLNDQYRTLGAASEGQRVQLVDLFDKLGAAHGQASEVAERTITRLSDSLQQIQRQLGSLSDQSQTAVGNIRTASTGFADQAGLLIQNAQQAEQQARTVLSVTAALQDQARLLRESLHGEGERTHEILGSLLGRLSSGGVELRDLGASTELVLNNLQNGLTQQAASLNGTMQQIADRQRTLTVALDAQRDVINGLLSRLTLAQDETASTAERTAARLTDGTQQLARQIEIIDTQAQSTLANVQAAGAHFADEAGALGLHAQQAEQQMRGVLSVTAGMQEQARQLREAMQGETARVIEQLNAVIAQLDTTNSQLKIQSTSAIHAMDQSTLQFGTLARTSADALLRQTEILSQTSVEAVLRMDNAGEKLKSHAKIVSDAGEQTEQQARQLADTAEYASSRLVTLRDTFIAGDKDGRETLAQASNRIEQVKAVLQGEIARLADASLEAVQKVAEASQQLTTQSDVLRSNLAVSESALMNATDLIREESGQIPAIVDRSTYKVEGAVAVLKNQATEAERTLIGTADRFIGVTTTARESMVDEMRRVSVVAEEAGQVLRSFNVTLSEQVTAMQEGTTSFSTDQKELVEKAGESINQLASASDRLAELRRDATQTAEKLAKEFDMLDQRASDTGQRLTHAGEIVTKQVEGLTQITQRAEGQMLDATKSFREQFERVRSSMQGQIDDINRGLMQITAQLERTGNTLRSTTAGTVSDVERISQRFDQTSKEAATQLVDKTARMRGATEEVAKLLSGFGDQLDVLLDRLSVAGDGIKRHEGDLIAQLETALSHLGSLAGRLEDGRALATNVSQQAVERLNSVVEAIQQQTQTLTVGTQTAAGVMRGVGQIYNDQTQALSRGVGEAHTQVQEMNKSIDDMQQRADRMRVSLKMQSEELMGSLSQILGQLHSTGDALSSAVDQALEEKAAAELKKIG